MPTLAVVVAHPDDDAYGIAGTVALHAADEEFRFVLVLATDGEGGDIREGFPATRETPGCRPPGRGRGRLARAGTASPTGTSGWATRTAVSTRCRFEELVELIVGGPRRGAARRRGHLRPGRHLRPSRPHRHRRGDGRGVRQRRCGCRRVRRSGGCSTAPSPSRVFSALERATGPPMAGELFDPTRMYHMRGVARRGDRSHRQDSGALADRVVSRTAASTAASTTSSSTTPTTSRAGSGSWRGSGMSSHGRRAISGPDPWPTSSTDSWVDLVSPPCRGGARIHPKSLDRCFSGTDLRQFGDGRCSVALGAGVD